MQPEDTLIPAPATKIQQVSQQHQKKADERVHADKSRRADKDAGDEQEAQAAFQQAPMQKVERQGDGCDKGDIGMGRSRQYEGARAKDHRAK